MPSPLRRAFALSGIVPIGVFLVLHLWTSAALLQSRDVYDAQLAAVNGLSILFVLELVLVFAPLAFHALYGLHLAFRPDDGPRTYASPRMFVLQRITGVLAFVFIAAHLFHLRAHTEIGALGYSTRLARDLSATAWGIPVAGLGYLVGIGVSVVHLVNGTGSYVFTRYRPSNEAKRRASVVLVVLGSLFFAVSALVVLQLATGTRLLPATESGKTGACGPSSASVPERAPANVLPSAAP